MVLLRRTFRRIAVSIERFGGGTADAGAGLCVAVAGAIQFACSRRQATQAVN